MNKRFVAVLVVIFVSVVVMSAMLTRASGDEAAGGAVANPALSVTATRLQKSSLPIRILATGNVAAWEEAGIGTQSDGLRLTATSTTWSNG
jgi:hypothetical protein